MTGPKTLAKCWSEWSEIVTRAASGHVVSKSISDSKYESLYRELLRACEAHATKENAAFFKKLASLVRPWVTLETLLKADSHICSDLAIKSQTIEAKLTGRRRRPPGSLVREFRWILILTVVGVFGYFLWQESDRLLHWNLFTTARAYSYRFVTFLRTTSFMERVGVFAAAVIVVGVILLKGMRKY